MEARAINETAHRVRSECGSVFRYAIATGRAERDPVADLRGALAPVVTRNHPAITDPIKIGELLRAIHGYRGRGHQSTEFALRLCLWYSYALVSYAVPNGLNLTSIVPSGEYLRPA